MLQSAVSLASTVAAVAIIVLPFLFAVDTSGSFQSVLLIEQFIIVELTLGLALVFWREARFETAVDRHGLDIALGMLALFAGLWATVRFESYGHGFSEFPLEPLILSILFLIMTLECCRRYAGLPMTGLICVFLVYGYAAQFLPSPLSAPGTSPSSYLKYIVVGGDALMGRAAEIITTVVVIFIAFGKMFEFAGGTEFIKNFAYRFTATSRGAPIKISILASGLVGSIIGSTSSNIMTSGSFSIPMMRQLGLRRSQAAAVEAVSSTGGQLTPPVMGFAAFLITEIAGIPYAHIIQAALIPSFLFYFSLFIQADRIAVQQEFGAQQGMESLGNRALLIQSIPFAVSIFVLIMCLVLYQFSPQWAAAMGTLTAIGLGVLRHGVSRDSLAIWFESLCVAGRASAGLIVLGASVGIMLGVINSTGLGVSFALAVTNAASLNLFAALLLAALASYVLGVGLATTAVYVIVGTLIAPSLVVLGIEPIAAHLFVFYSAMLSMITPPVAIACLVASGLAGASFFNTSFYAVRFGWLKFFLPFMFVYSPELLMIGDPQDILFAVAAVMTGIVFYTSATIGYEQGAVSWPLRLVYLLVSVVLMLPLLPIDWRIVLSVVGIIWLNRARLRTFG